MSPRDRDLEVSAMLDTLAKSDRSACDGCGRDVAEAIDDFREFRTCRCCCSCERPGASVDVHAKTDDDSDVEPHCHGCMVEAVDKMLADGWARDSFELRPLPPSDRALRLAAA